MEQVPLVPGYEVLEPLGQGASATVWRARRLGDGLDVALKILTPGRGDVEAGLREAGLLAALRHPHLVRLHDVVPLPDPQTGRPAAVALATQLAGGGSLGQVLTRRRILSAGELVTALQPVAGALADLHGQGVVHGDLSTGNVLFLRDGMPLLSDLGAARITGAPAGDPQGTGAASGLVAPEVVEGFPPTQESDVYQLGAVAWLCLIGDPPGPVWSRGTLEELAPGLPPGLADLVGRCLAPEPGDRPDAEEVALALLATATPEPVEVAPDADPGHGLTERLRRQAKEDLGPVPIEEPRRRRFFSRPGRREGDDRNPGRRGRAVRRSGTHRPERVIPSHHASVEGQRDRSGVLAWVAVAVAVLLVLGVGAAVPLMGSDVARLVRGEETTSSAPSTPSGTATPADAEDRGDVAGQPDAAGGDDALPSDTAGGDEVLPSDTAGGDEVSPPDTSGDEGLDHIVTAPGEVSDADATLALQALVDGRAKAWQSGDVTALAEVMAAGSPALSAETATLQRAGDQGLTYPAVSFSVDEATVVGEDGEERLTVDAVVTREQLRGVDADGRTVVEEPSTTEEVRLVLSRAGASDPWLLWSWAPG